MAVAHESAAESILVAHAKTTGPREAAEDIERQLRTAELAMVVVFVSPFYDPSAFIREISSRIPNTPVYGCTTAGELAPQGWEEDSVVALGFNSADFVIAACVLPDLSTFRVDRGRSLCGELHRRTRHFAGGVCPVAMASSTS